MSRNIKANRIVVKIGTSTLTDSTGTLDIKAMSDLVAQIANIKNKKKEIIIITSGAIGAGKKELNLKKRIKQNDVITKQSCAAVGQSILMAAYHSLFRRFKIKIAQILLTYDDFSNIKTYTNLSNSINRLLKLGVIPIINENDPISIDEIGASFGDNDLLSALIANKMHADLLVMLTNVDGLFNKNQNNKNPFLIKEVYDNKKIKIDDLADLRDKNHLGIGGIKTKIDAAKLATNSGITVVIANGRASNVLIKVLNNEDIGTIFYPKCMER